MSKRKHITNVTTHGGQKNYHFHKVYIGDIELSVSDLEYRSDNELEGCILTNDCHFLTHKMKKKITIFYFTYGHTLLTLLREFEVFLRVFKRFKDTFLGLTCWSKAKIVQK